MSGVRKISELGDILPLLPTDDDWTLRWNERGNAVRAILGETAEPGMVHSFSWKDYILPGACAMTYKQPDSTFLYMTLGLTQPLHAADPVYPWEFAIRAQENVEWPIDLLYQLLSQWLWENGNMGFGYQLPLSFFMGHDDRMWASIAAGVQYRRVVGDIRGLYLWTDFADLSFKASSGEFRLLGAVAVTEDEDALAIETTPAHLILLLRRMGITQLCDPYRRSVLYLAGASDEWDQIKGKSHDDAFDELQHR